MCDWDQIEAEIIAQNQKLSDSVDANTIKQRFEASHALAVREGWSDEEGNSLLPPNEDDEND